MQTNNEDFDKEEVERKAKKILFDEEVRRLSAGFEERAKQQKADNEENMRIKKEWLNENSHVGRLWPDDFILSYTLEQLKELVAEIEEKAEVDDKKAKAILISILIVILVAVFAYTAKAYLMVAFLLFILLCIIGLIVPLIGSTEQKDQMQFGSLNAHMKCPHCNASGNIHTKPITQKKGISGSKAAAGLLTGGASLLVVGLSRKENSTQAHCKKCGNTWQF